MKVKIMVTLAVDPDEYPVPSDGDVTEDFEDACEVDDKIRHGLKNTTSELFLHKSAKPLRDINFLEPKKKLQKP